MMKKIRILIVDDHPLMRRALQSAVLVEPDIEVVGLASNGEEAQKMIAETNPDLVLVDWLMPFGESENIKTMSENYPETKILVITSLNNGSIIAEALDAGASGFITKEAEPGQLIEAIRAVASGNFFLPQILVSRLISFMHKQRDNKSVQGKTEDIHLTSREKQIFIWIGKGAKNSIIAKELGISDATVRVHIFNIMNKYKFTSRSQLIAYAATHSS